MSNESDSEQIIAVIEALIGDIHAHGEEHADKIVRENQKKLTEVIDSLVWMIVRNVKYTNRAERSMWLIGNDAREFLGYLAEEYGLADYIEDKE